MTVGGPLTSDSSVKRDPPPLPTPVGFPNYGPPYSTDPSQRPRLREVVKLYAGLKSGLAVKAAHARALNIRLHPEGRIQDIITDHEDPSPTNYSFHMTSEAVPNLRDGRQTPAEDRFTMLKKELSYTNEDALRELQRKPPLEGHEKPRLAHLRKFWDSLEMMIRYWDTSADEYGEESRSPSPSKQPPRSTTNTAETENMEVDSPRPPERGRKQTYTGLRIGTGRGMPDNFRVDTIRTFVEPIAWAFGCQIGVSSLPPRLQVGNLLVPVRQNHTIVRTPADRSEARKGIGEGPLCFIQCRHETEFSEENETAAMLDLLREVGGMLLLAQMRAREGKEEIKPGEGKWYTTKPRWGGGAGGEIGNTENNSDESSPKEKEGDEDKRAAAGSSNGRKRVKRPSPAEAWKLLAPGNGLWDRRIRYMRLGKEKDKCYDEVRILS